MLNFRLEVPPIPEILSKDEKQSLFDRSLKKFVRIIKKSGLMNELKERRYYVAPSKRRRMKKEKAKRAAIREGQK